MTFLERFFSKRPPPPTHTHTGDGEDGKMVMAKMAKHGKQARVNASLNTIIIAVLLHFPDSWVFSVAYLALVHKKVTKPVQMQEL